MAFIFFAAAVLFLVLWLVTRSTVSAQNAQVQKCMSEKETLSEEIKKNKQKYEQLEQEFHSYLEVNEDILQLEKKKQEIKKQFEDEKKKMQEELAQINGEITAQMVDISEYENITSEETKNQLAMLKNRFSELTKNDQATRITGYDISKKAASNNKKQILLCFNAQCDNIISNVTHKNIDTARGKVQRAFDNLNKIFEVDGVQLTPAVLEMKLEELTLVYAYMVKKEQEREEQKAIREQMLEEEKVRREIEREKAKAEKEEKQFQNEITKLMAYMQKANDVEKQLYVDKIKELEEKLKEVEKTKENILEREQNTRAGFVYVISNIGSFGEDVYKIGMTRRLEPMDRVKELGDASVPFEFDVHAMIFSEDAPALETILHQTFKKNQVNKVNDRKEFFRVSLNEIERVVKENYNATVTFTKMAEAAQYRESVKLAEQNQ